jgi:hypothetical protein
MNYGLMTDGWFSRIQTLKSESKSGKLHYPKFGIEKIWSTYVLNLYQTMYA